MWVRTVWGVHEGGVWVKKISENGMHALEALRVIHS